MLRNAKAINCNDLLTDSATENIPPIFVGKDEKVE